MIELDTYTDGRWFFDGKAFLHEIDSIISSTKQWLLIRRLPNMPVYDIGIGTVDVDGLSKDVVYNVKYCKEFDKNSLLHDFDVKLKYVVNEDNDRADAKDAGIVQSILFRIIKDNRIPNATPKEGTNTTS